LLNFCRKTGKCRATKANLFDGWATLPNNFSDLGEVSISPHRHLCSKGIRLVGVAENEPGEYLPSMRQLARYRDSYPVDELVSDVFPLAAVEAAVERSVHPDSLKVVISPWAE